MRGHGDDFDMAAEEVTTSSDQLVPPHDTDRFAAARLISCDGTVRRS
jgi:hypothetical protein